MTRAITSVILTGFLATAAFAASQPVHDREHSLEQLAWMVGTWSGEYGGVLMEEHWMSAAGQVMPGLHRDVRPGKKAFFEFLRIEQGDSGIVYLASPKGAPATAFPLKLMEKRKVVFENLEHDFPQRLIYWRDEEDRLHARIEGTVDGKERSSEWAWQRAK